MKLPFVQPHQFAKLFVRFLKTTSILNHWSGCRARPDVKVRTIGAFGPESVAPLGGASRPGGKTAVALGEAVGEGGGMTARLVGVAVIVAVGVGVDVAVGIAVGNSVSVGVWLGGRVAVRTRALWVVCVAVTVGVTVFGGGTAVIQKEGLNAV
jgi:hypothetical protein